MTQESSSSFQTLLQKIHSLQLPQQAQTAIDLAQEGLKLFPQNPDLHYLLGIVYEYIQAFDLSWENHEKAIRHGPGRFPFLGNTYSYDQLKFDEVETFCPLCGETRHQIARVVNVTRASPVYDIFRPLRKWVQCSGCSQLYVRPRPSRAALEKYIAVEGERLAKESQSIRDLSQAELRRLLFIENSCPKISHTKKLLDIGSSFGGFVYQALQKGYDAYGLELSPHKLVPFFPANEHHRIFQANIDDTSLDQDSYDIITAYDIIEHVEHPKSFIQNIKNALRPGGLLCLSTPDFQSIKAREEGREHILWFAVEHLIYFSLEGLKQFCKGLGFEFIGQRSSELVPGGVEAIFEVKK